MVSDIYQRPNKSYFQEPPELQSQVGTGKLMHKILANQVNIDKISKIIQMNVLKGTHLFEAVKEIQKGYLISPYFKDLYLSNNDTRSTFSQGTEPKFVFSYKLSPRSPTMAFSSVRENVAPTHSWKLFWEMLMFIIFY